MLPRVLESAVPLAPPSRGTELLLTNIVKVLLKALAIVFSPEGIAAAAARLDGDMMTWQQKFE